jgi:hypothetical protein
VTRRPPKPAAVRSAKQAYSAGNLECACIIAGQPETFPEGSLPALWADVVLSKAAEPDDAEAGPLFRQAA